MPFANSYEAPEGNRLLAMLPRRDFLRLAPSLEKVSLGIKTILYEFQEPIEHVYFPIGGVISLVVQMRSGESTEIATIGGEGMVGTPLVLGARRSSMRVFSQVPGESLRLPAKEFRQELAREGALYAVMQRYIQALMNQISQTVACNQLHSVEQRM